ncbi:MAG TPA: carbohydrate porin [Terrimicrobiaceae bacterium]
MNKLFRFTFGFLTFSFSLLRAETQSLEGWWKGKGAAGDLFGVRPTLEDRGIDFSGHWSSVFAGAVAGGLEHRGTFVEQVLFELDVDFAKLSGWDALEGLTFSAGGRWRDGELINPFIGTTSLFSPVSYRSGHGWRLMPFYLTYTTPELFGKKEFLTISGGWQNPNDIFAQQPESKFFRNNGIIDNKGISANDVEWSSSYAAWGGYVKVKPTDWYYAMAGLYMAFPDGTGTGNRGLDFDGSPGHNGLWFIGETGVTPKLGPAKLPGKYVFGGYYWGIENESFNGDTNPGKYGFYWQAAQMLWREPSAPTVQEKSGDAKSFKATAAATKPKLSDQGLTWFSWFHYAPSYNGLRPFYFNTGLIYKGLIPSRDRDQVGVAFAYGNFSEDNQTIQEANNLPVQTYEALLECDYRIQLNKWAYVQPFVEYVIRPGGAGVVDNATVLGVHFRVNF